MCKSEQSLSTLSNFQIACQPLTNYFQKGTKMPLTRTPMKAEADESSTRVNNMVPYTFMLGDEQTTIQVSQREHVQLTNPSISKENRQATLESICRNLGIWERKPPAAEVAAEVNTSQVANVPASETATQQALDEQEFADIENRSKKLDRTANSPTDTLS